MRRAHKKNRSITKKKTQNEGQVVTTSTLIKFVLKLVFPRQRWANFWTRYHNMRKKKVQEPLTILWAYSTKSKGALIVMLIHQEQ